MSPTRSSPSPGATCRRPQACTFRSTPASPPPSSGEHARPRGGRPGRLQWPGHARPRRPRRRGIDRGPPVPQRRGPPARRVVLGHSGPLPGHPGGPPHRRAARPRAPRSRAGRARDRLLGRGLRTARRKRNPARQPRHYRDPRTDPVIDTVHHQIDPGWLYAVTGVQFLPFNTLYQFAAEPDLTGHRALLVPDLLGYWLTGRQVAEETNASTTGLLDARTGRWASELVEALGLPAGLLAEVIAAGQVLAPVSEAVREDLGIDRELLVSTVGSHDTASSIVAVPAAGPNFGYVSCGTWGLVGVELDAPVLTGDSRRANFTNERGVDGT